MCEAPMSNLGGLQHDFFHFLASSTFSLSLTVPLFMVSITVNSFLMFMHSFLTERNLILVYSPRNGECVFSLVDFNTPLRTTVNSRLSSFGVVT